MTSYLVTFTHETRLYAELNAYLSYYAQAGDYSRATHYQKLLATADGRYDFSRATLNEIVDASRHVEVRPVTLAEWLASVWQTE